MFSLCYFFNLDFSVSNFRNGKLVKQFPTGFILFNILNVYNSITILSMPLRFSLDLWIAYGLKANQTENVCGWKKSTISFLCKLKNLWLNLHKCKWKKRINLVAVMALYTQKSEVHTVVCPFSKRNERVCTNSKRTFQIGMLFNFFYLVCCFVAFWCCFFRCHLGVLWISKYIAFSHFSCAQPGIANMFSFGFSHTYFVYVYINIVSNAISFSVTRALFLFVLCTFVAFLSFRCVPHCCKSMYICRNVLKILLSHLQFSLKRAIF